MMKNTVLGLMLTLAVAPSLVAVQIQAIGTHNAKFNLDGTVLGVYRDHQPLIIKNVGLGAHKLYIKSLVTGELKVFNFTAVYGKALDEFKASFAPPRDTKNMKARRRTALVVALTASEIIADDGDEKRKGRKIVGGLAVVNELFPSKRHDRTYSKKYGNTIEVKTQVDVEINLDFRGKKFYKVNEGKRFHNLAAGWHKLFIRNVPTQELKVFKIEFPAEGTRTVTIRPQFAPPRGETVNAKARRRTGLLAALAGNEVVGDSGTGRKDRRKGLLAGAVLNELIPTNRGRRRAPITIDYFNLGRVPQTIEDYDAMYKK